MSLHALHLPVQPSRRSCSLTAVVNHVWIPVEEDRQVQQSLTDRGLQGVDRRVRWRRDIALAMEYRVDAILWDPHPYNISSGRCSSGSLARTSLVQ